jgi:hypothetical protein
MENYINLAFYLIKYYLPIFQKFDIKLNTMSYWDFEEGNDPAFINILFNVRTNTLEFVINIINDIDVYREQKAEDYYKFLNNNKEFLDTFNIELDDRTFILNCLLHEFGHAEQSIKAFNYGKYINFLDCTNIVNTSVGMAFNIHSKLVSEYDISYNFGMDEIYAEMFKYKYFMYFYNLLNINRSMVVISDNVKN